MTPETPAVYQRAGLVLEGEAETSPTPTCIDCDTDLMRGCCSGLVCCHCYERLRDDQRRHDAYRDRGWLR